MLKSRLWHLLTSADDTAMLLLSGFWSWPSWDDSVTDGQTKGPTQRQKCSPITVSRYAYTFATLTRNEQVATLTVASGRIVAPAPIVFAKWRKRAPPSNT